MAKMWSENYEWISTSHPLGEGSFGIVYEGYKKENPNELVAIKCGNRFNVAGGELTRRRDEYDRLRLHPHGNIVKVIAIEEELTPGRSGQVLIMELCNGGNLFDMIRENPNGLRDEQFLVLLKDVTAAVKHLRREEVKITHRDIKPANILRHVQGGQEVYKLADFGTARVFENRTDFSTYCGTINYMHPSIYGKFELGKDVEVDDGVDLWSLGATFHHAVAAKLPFVFKSPAAMFDITANKELGVIAANGPSKRPVKFTTLPETCQLSPALREQVTYLLSKLMEIRNDHRFTYSQYFDYVDTMVSQQ